MTWRLQNRPFTPGEEEKPTQRRVTWQSHNREGIPAHPSPQAEEEKQSGEGTETQELCNLALEIFWGTRVHAALGSSD